MKYDLKETLSSTSEIKIQLGKIQHVLSRSYWFQQASEQLAQGLDVEDQKYIEKLQDIVYFLNELLKYSVFEIHQELVKPLTCKVEELRTELQHQIAVQSVGSNFTEFTTSKSLFIALQEPLTVLLSALQSLEDSSYSNSLASMDYHAGLYQDCEPSETLVSCEIQELLEKMMLSSKTAPATYLSLSGRFLHELLWLHAKMYAQQGKLLQLELRHAEQLQTQPRML